jgi:signal transduction histidine kinase
MLESFELGNSLQKDMLVGDESQTAAELDTLVTFLQADGERKSSSVARKLHDELGGCVIGAMMDVAWIEQHEPGLPPDTVMRLARVNDGLRGAIDLTRKIVEELRPTLLDSMGLFAALSWQFRLGCKQAKVNYSENFPALAPEMNADRLISLFRIAQELFNLALQRESLGALALAVTVKDGLFILEITMNGKSPVPAEGAPHVSAPMLSIMHRVRQLKGHAAFTSLPDGSASFCVTVPVA